ncbi:hypothetical protein CH330_07095 [candidate division WOR-3 bacterium JGI_Cruoil_03_51_56]|uniref:Uncharacterized protein n=1 Tax=candidate division WOR-3 bacterium JGI_Cruoil_03_51_56 TaxID=1973747 RepID=A0A235BRU2_UNCW3|nr:MAG: hypothetical protein CH330_07095 [candidate division WOR-3 bacterium JGI_Cruoil_03_51_56]
MISIRRRQIAVGVLLLVALVLRFVFITLAKEHEYNFSGTLPFTSESEMLKQGLHTVDSQEYLFLAEGLKKGVFGWDGRPNSFRTPGYPLLLAVLDNNLFLLFIVQVSLSTMTVFLVWAGAKRLFGEKAGFIAAGFLAFDLANIFFVGVVMAETLFVFLVVLGSYLFIRRHFQWTGIVLGSAALVRPIGIFFFLPFGIALATRKKWKRLAFFLVMFALLPGLWIGRNIYRFGRPGFSSIGGFNLYYANAAILVQEQTGLSEDSVRVLLTREVARENREDNPMVLSSILTRLALRRIGADPLRYLWIHMRGLGPVVFGIKSDEIVGRITGHGGPSLYKSAQGRGLCPFVWYLAGFELALTLAALVLAIASLVRRDGRRKRLLLLFVGCYFLIMASPLTDGRFRVPAMPFVYVVAASFFASRFRSSGQNGSG